MVSELEGVEMNEDDDTIVTEYSCPFCGLEFSITDTPISQMKNYPYFKNRNDI